MDSLIESIKSRAYKLDFDDIGFCEANITKEVSKHLKEFVLEGRHGSMNWIADTLDRRSNPKNMWKKAKTAIILGSNYGPNSSPLKKLKNKNCGNISVYAQNKDYHKIIKGRLKNLAGWIVSKTKGEVKVFVDTAPLMEKPLAEAAGIGWIGKHTNLVSPNFGSWLFLGVILIDVNILNNASSPNNNKCGTCSKCIDICPTNAFLSPYKLDARKCISYLTIENKGHIPREFRKVIKNRIYGCDDCLAVCPWNKFAQKSNNISFIAREDLKKPSLKSLLLLSDSEFRSLFAGSPIKRIGRNQFIRNVLIAIGNSSDKSLIKTIKILLNDNSILVRVASVWALSMLSKKVFLDEIDKRIKYEKNKIVINEWLESKEEIIRNSKG
jgi:epoxyqueuosine reductase